MQEVPAISLAWGREADVLRRALPRLGLAKGSWRLEEARTGGIVALGVLVFIAVLTVAFVMMG